MPVLTFLTADAWVSGPVRAPQKFLLLKLFIKIVSTGKTVVYTIVTVFFTLILLLSFSLSQHCCDIRYFNNHQLPRYFMGRKVFFFKLRNIFYIASQVWPTIETLGWSWTKFSWKVKSMLDRSHCNGNWNFEIIGFAWSWKIYNSWWEKGHCWRYWE